MKTDSALQQRDLKSGTKIFWVVACLALAILWLGTAISYPFLPQLVPQNFHADGSFRGESPRWHIWLLPVIAAMLHWLMSYASKREVEKNNIAHIDAQTPVHVKGRVQQLNQSMIWFLVGIINTHLAWVQSIYIGTATGWWPRMPSLTLWMVLALGIGIVYYFAKILKASQQ